MSEDIDSGDHIRLIQSNSSNSELDLEAPRSKKSGITGLLKQLDLRMSGRRLSRRHHDGGLEPFDRPPPADALGDGAPPEWALLPIGSLLGLAIRLCVAAFNQGLANKWIWNGLSMVIDTKDKEKLRDSGKH